MGMQINDGMNDDHSKIDVTKSVILLLQCLKLSKFDFLKCEKLLIY